MRIALNLQVVLDGMYILIKLILLIHKHGMCFHLFISSLTFFFNVLSFPSTDLLASWLNILLCTLFFVAIVNRSFIFLILFLIETH